MIEAPVKSETLESTSPLADSLPLTPVQRPKSSSSPRIYLNYLDGLRGAASLYVFLRHIWQFIIIRPDLGKMPGWFHAFSVLRWGGYAPAVFTILSGYCLMLPIVRSDELPLVGGVPAFIKRRSRRILPPYYAAIALSLLMLLLFPALRHKAGTQWDIALPALTAGSLLSHLVGIHNLFPQWRWSLDPPLWTLSLEFQIYFIFSLILLPVCRKRGVMATICTGFGLGAIPLFFGWTYMSSWFVGLFALGMTACAINFSHADSPHVSAFWRDRVPWRAVSIVLAVVAAIATAFEQSTTATFERSTVAIAHELPTIVAEVALGFAVAAYLVVTTRAYQTGAAPGLLARLFTSRPLARMGKFSYSLYLIHFPIIAVFYHALYTHVSPEATFLILLLGVAPLTVGLAYLFHCLVERPFVSRR
jgi:peptidoglycan/LPS O-acetylase OafA/YrhL